MGKLKVVALSGNLGGRSRTRSLVDAVVGQIGERADIALTAVA
ncbi:hypothetical protein [Azospirillum doebereinerae]